MKRYLRALTLLDVMLCMFVVFIHIASEAVSAYQQDSLAFGAVFFLWKAVSFAVPGFVFLAGFRFFYSYRAQAASFDYAHYVKGRITKIYLPYVLWVCVYYLYFVDRRYFDFNFADLPGYVFFGNLVSHFYFIVIIMQFYLLAPVWIRLVRHRFVPVFAAALCLTVFFRAYFPALARLALPGAELRFQYNDRVFTSYLVFWVAGCYAGLYEERCSETVDRRGAWIAAAFVAVASVHLVRSYLAVRQLVGYRHAEVVHILFCMTGVAAAYALFRRASARFDGTAVSRGLHRVGAVTFYIYLSHILIMLLVVRKLDSLGITSLTVRLVWKAALTFPAAIGLSLGYDAVKRAAAKILSPKN